MYSPLLWRGLLFSDRTLWTPAAHSTAVESSWKVQKAKVTIITTGPPGFSWVDLRFFVHACQTNGIRGSNPSPFPNGHGEVGEVASVPPPLAYQYGNVVAFGCERMQNPWSLCRCWRQHHVTNLRGTLWSWTSLATCSLTGPPYMLPTQRAAFPFRITCEICCFFVSALSMGQDGRHIGRQTHGSGHNFPDHPEDNIRDKTEDKLNEADTTSQTRCKTRSETKVETKWEQTQGSGRGFPDQMGDKLRGTTGNKVGRRQNPKKADTASHISCKRRQETRPEKSSQTGTDP